MRMDSIIKNRMPASLHDLPSGRTMETIAAIWARRSTVQILLLFSISLFSFISLNIGRFEGFLDCFIE
jgi:hypothetical protein